MRWAHNAVVRNNVCAFSMGEVGSCYRSGSDADSDDGRISALITGNVFIGNSVNCYLQGQQHAIVRNKICGLCSASQSETRRRPADYGIQQNPDGFDQTYSRTRVYRLGSNLSVASEAKNAPDHRSRDLRIYNNLLLYGMVNFRSAIVIPKKEAQLPAPWESGITQLYFGHNTIVARPPFEKNSNEKTVGESVGTH